jgi:hypothetical protein
MEINITMHEPISENTIIDENKSLVNNLVETPKTITKPKKKLSDEDINTIINNVFSNIGDYLTENTRFEHMRDEIINNRMRIIIKEKINVRMSETILKFIKFLDEDEYIKNYYAQFNKITFDISFTEDLHTYIYENLYSEFDYIPEIAQRWFNCNVYDNVLDFIITNIVIKCVFQQYNNKYGNGYEFIDSNSKEEQKQNSDEDVNANTSSQNNSDDSDNSDDKDDKDDSDNVESKEKNECNIN